MGKVHFTKSSVMYVSLGQTTVILRTEYAECFMQKTYLLGRLSSFQGFVCVMLFKQLPYKIWFFVYSHFWSVTVMFSNEFGNTDNASDKECEVLICNYYNGNTCIFITECPDVLIKQSLYIQI